MASPSGKKLRLDQALVARGLCDSREQAKRLILAGEVVVEGMSLGPGPLKPGLNVTEGAEIRVKSRPKYVGRGGLKLEKALDEFGIDPAGKVVFDIGSSTGGFTDCCLQRGAKHVHAYDVGTNQLAWKLRDDERVTSREGVNVRHLQPEDFPGDVGLVVIDVSFISLTLILPVAFAVLEHGSGTEGDLVCLIKPQFELGREEVGKGGIVRDPILHDRAVEKVRRFVEEGVEEECGGMEWRGVIESPITGTDGNVEFLAWVGPREPGA